VQERKKKRKSPGKEEKKKTIGKGFSSRKGKKRGRPVIFPQKKKKKGLNEITKRPTHSTSVLPLRKKEGKGEKRSHPFKGGGKV